MLTLDHVIIGVQDLDQATADYRALGFNAFYGGRHASGTTHNALICFQDGTYLELLAPVDVPTGTSLGDPPQPGTTDFSVLLQKGEGLTGYALLSLDLAVEVEALRARGVTVGEMSEGRRLRTDGVELRWRSVSLEGGRSPFLIEDITPRNQRVPGDSATVTHRNGVTGIAKLEGADFALMRGDQKLTGIVFTAPAPVTFDPAKTHKVRLSVE